MNTQTVSIGGRNHPIYTMQKAQSYDYIVSATCAFCNQQVYNQTVADTEEGVIQASSELRKHCQSEADHGA